MVVRRYCSPQKSCRIRQATSRFLCALATCAAFVQPAPAADLITFWDSPQKGANAFNAVPQGEDYYTALAGTGATWVRLVFSKWESAQREFLIGDADHYSGLVPEDLATLRQTLDVAHAAGLKVVIAPLSLPGARWAQHNDRTYDDRLWSDPEFQVQAVKFWLDLATALKDHPAVAGYNILNEPAPEKASDLQENASVQSIADWQLAQAGGLRDLQSFYARVIGAVRTVDAVTPVMVDSGWYANPRALASWPAALADPRVLYAFHMYEPYAATSPSNMKRDEPLQYPGVMTEYAGEDLAWDRAAVAAHIDLAFDWAEAQKIPPSRIVAAEFGCMRRWADCGTYLTDVLDAVEARGGHWAFYAFREDEWEGMDYELSTKVTPGQFYWLSEEGKADRIPRDGKLMGILRARMQK